MSQNAKLPLLTLVLVLGLAGFGSLVPTGSEPTPLARRQLDVAQTCAGFYDDFSSTTLDAAWTWINEDEWTLTERPDYLRVRTEFTEEAPTYLLREASGDIGQIWSHLEVQPAGTLQHAGIILYQDENNWLRLTRQSGPEEEILVLLAAFLNGEPQIQFVTPDATLASLGLQLRRRGNEWIGEYAAVPDGEPGEWTTVATLAATFSNPRAGLIATADENDEAPVDFDDFCLEAFAATTPTVEATGTATPSPTTTPADLTLTGRVYDAEIGPTQGIPNADVSLVSCFPRRFPTLSEEDGSYELFVPADYLTPCTEVSLEVSAKGYQPLSPTLAVSDLYAQPQRDFALVPWPFYAYLPLIARSSAPLEPTPTPTPTGPPPEPTPTAFDPMAFDLELEPVTDELDRPVYVTPADDGSGRLFVVEKTGVIRIIENGTVNLIPFLDITSLVGSSGSEQGLLGVAFHPDYTTNGLFFVNYTDNNGDTVVARYSVGDDPNMADPDSAQTILTLDQPASNHNGGLVLFGPDGYLYVGTGDGGQGGDPWGNAQNGEVLLGKMLRLDVDSGAPYAIPPDNPFVDDPAFRDEIWALGLRNPWRYSFDRGTGDLYIADVGQGSYEEVNFQLADSSGGENYGWDIMEGTHCFEPSSGCDQTGLKLPVAEYAHTAGNCSVTGGYFYRGSDFPRMAGAYYFGDYCSGRIWALYRDDANNWIKAEMLDSALQISSFGEDEAGELYLTSLSDGGLYRLTASE